MPDLPVSICCPEDRPEERDPDVRCPSPRAQYDYRHQADENTLLGSPLPRQQIRHLDGELPVL